VFWGIFIGVVPIYGLQTLTAICMAAIFKLNKPLTLGATFINNPILQPSLIFFSIEMGHFLRCGELLQLASFRLHDIDLKSQFSDWIVGALVLGLLLGILIAFFAAVMFSRALDRRSRPADLPAAKCFVTKLFRQSPQFARGFVRWKLRLDKIFGMLLMEDLCRGPAVDLGCGYGIALAIAAFRHSGLRLIGCDLDQNRVHVANHALSSLNAQLSVHDIRSFEFPEAGLIMIIDVLQYLGVQEQQALLKRCCASLQPNGTLIFRVPDRESGLLSKLTMILDNIIFRSAGNRAQPTVLSQQKYEKILQDADMLVQKQRITSRLPLAHVLFRAKKLVRDAG
jgi:SAM-dependent methyltransferase